MFPKLGLRFIIEFRVYLDVDAHSTENERRKRAKKNVKSPMKSIRNIRKVCNLLICRKQGVIIKIVSSLRRLLSKPRSSLVSRLVFVECKFPIFFVSPRFISTEFVRGIFHFPLELQAKQRRGENQI